MLDIGVIQGRGFRNVVEGGQVTGFEVRLRNPNYRGVAASLIDGVEIVVDGHRIEDHVAQWIVQGKRYTLDELRRSTDARWSLEEAVTLFVPMPGGLATGHHELSMNIYIRRSYFPPAIERSFFAVTGSGIIVPEVPEGDLGFCVSTYSYAGEMNTTMTLSDVIADIADLGATGIELLGEGNVSGYPNPTSEWIDTWHSLIQQHGLTPTNYGSWIDTTRWSGRDLTVEEAVEQLQLDMRLAHRLGFTSLRPKIGVTSWELDPHPVWREAVTRSLDLAAELNIVICPEIHAPTPIKHRATQGYLDFIAESGSDHFKLLIDTGIFQTAPVLDNPEGIDSGDGNEVPEHLRPLAVPMEDLREVLPHVHFIQAKFFEIDDDLNDLHVPWAPIVDTLLDAGWKGWLSSEYEGRRDPYRGPDQVRRQHALIRSLVADRSR